MCANAPIFAKSAAIFKKHEQARFSMSLTSGLSRDRRYDALQTFRS
jgi:hypothetical protein